MPQARQDAFTINRNMEFGLSIVHTTDCGWSNNYLRTYDTFGEALYAGIGPGITLSRPARCCLRDKPNIACISYGIGPARYETPDLD